MKHCYTLFLLALMMFAGISNVYADDSKQSDDCSALKATMPVVESGIKSVESQLIACLENEQNKDVKIRFSYNETGKINKVSVENARKDAVKCIKDNLKEVVFDFDVSAIMQKRMKEVMPAKPFPVHKANGELDGWKRGTVSAYMPDGKVTLVYKPNDKAITIKTHYMIGRTRGWEEINECYQ